MPAQTGDGEIFKRVQRGGKGPHRLTSYEQSANLERIPKPNPRRAREVSGVRTSPLRLLRRSRPERERLRTHGHRVAQGTPRHRAMLLVDLQGPRGFLQPGRL
jgi:hypothetical protein